MTDNQINCAIAEACGWKSKVNEMASTEKYKSWTRPPNYCRDLNAMHEAEKALSPEQYDRWRLTPTIITEPETCAYSATARQRAEAFLKTIGKWK